MTTNLIRDKTAQKAQKTEIVRKKMPKSNIKFQNMIKKMPPKSTKLQHYSLSQQNTIKLVGWREKKRYAPIAISDLTCHKVPKCSFLI